MNYKSQTAYLTDEQVAGWAAFDPSRAASWAAREIVPLAREVQESRALREAIDALVQHHTYEHVDDLADAVIALIHPEVTS